MATKKKPRPAAARSKKPKAKGLPFHAFWSGALSFGLVNVPVLVFPATRHSGVRLRMISPEGSPVHRRFFCPRDGKEVDGDEVIKGFELDDGTYITVTDAELQAAEPQKTREIELKQFVDIADLPPALFERGYYLTPEKEATKAYRLLADAMERTRRAGIATFVMRDREYLVAIFAEQGILCAETLRFENELRDPAKIGLPAIEFAKPQRVSAFAKAIEALSAKTIAREELEDSDTRRLKAIIEKKKRAGRDLITLGGEPESGVAKEDDEEDVDLLETIRRSLRTVGGGTARSGGRKAARQEPAPQRGSKLRSRTKSGPKRPRAK